MSGMIDTALRCPSPIVGSAAENVQYLIFKLAGEQYGIDILKVREIRDWTPVTPMPRTPIFVQGIMNLRGFIVPVIDLRLRFELKAAECAKLMVVNVRTARGNRIVGLVVDAVTFVLNVEATDIQPGPDCEPDCEPVIWTEFISGSVAVEAGEVMLLDVDRLLSAGEMFELGVALSQMAA